MRDGTLRHRAAVLLRAAARKLFRLPDRRNAAHANRQDDRQDGCSKHANAPRILLGIMRRVCSFRPMVRRAIAIATMLLLTGIVPLGASSGFCADKPCCRSHGPNAAAFASHPACCNETNCAPPSRNTEATVAKSIAAQPHFVADAVTVVVTPPIVTRSCEVLAVESPPTSRRLATLSILLI
jgi:hypothetical protein